jgi:dihydropteroate synthase
VGQLRLRNHTFELGKKTLIMGVLNVTPDSFSGDGTYGDRDRAVSQAVKMAQTGADMIDVGGESTRPGSSPISAEVELRRVVPAVKRLVDRDIVVSVDTYKPTVARKVLDLGVDAINDITGLRNPRMAAAVAEHDAGVIIMHMKGEPKTMQEDPVYRNGVTKEVKNFLKSQIWKAQNAGIRSESIVIDPGIGFGKTVDHNLELIRNLGSLRDLDKPILVGPSRKGFLGRLLGLPAELRLEGTLAVVVASVMNGADIVRVHDVPECKRAVTVADAISRGDRPNH